VPEPAHTETRETAGRDRSAAERSADRATIAGSIDDLLPTLIAKLGATELAELEVREDGIRVRLRRPTDAAGPRNRRSTDRGERGDRAARGLVGSSAASHPAGPTAVGPGREGHDGRDGHDSDARDDGRAVATSPAVGIFQVAAGARPGTRVRSGDRIGTVDMLGVPQEVVAPADGLVGASLVEPGDAVEYGQGLVVIEFASPAAAPPTAPPSSTIAADG
jgi:biotin carboxyl carrier protein